MIRRKIIKKSFLFILFFILSIYVFPSDVGEGLSLLEKKDYKNSIKYFGKIAKKSPSPGIYYNLAISYWKSEKKGWAIYYLYKALNLKPDYKKAQVAINRISEKENINNSTFLIKLYFNVFILLFILINVLFFIFILRKVKIRKFLFIFLFLALIIFAGLYFNEYNKILNLNSAIIVFSGDTGLFSEPDEDSLIIHNFKGGTKITILKELGSWYQIRKNKELFGWIKAEKVKKI